MLIATLNHNLPELTDNLAKQLENNKLDYELLVIDNGSTEPLPKSTTHELKQNYFFGGGFNIVLDYFLSSKHKYFAVLNNDLIFHGHNVLDHIHETMETDNISLYSPTVINAGIGQCKWTPVHNWGSGKLRDVPFIDFQCPFIRRDLAESISHFPDDLYLGYGLDFFACILAQRNNFRVCVDDRVTFCHLENQTLKRDKLTTISKEQYYKNNMDNMINYFNNSEYKEDFYKLWESGQTYKYIK